MHGPELIPRLSNPRTHAYLSCISLPRLHRYLSPPHVYCIRTAKQSEYNRYMLHPMLLTKYLRDLPLTRSSLLASSRRCPPNIGLAPFNNLYVSLPLHCGRVADLLSRSRVSSIALHLCLAVHGACPCYTPCEPLSTSAPLGPHFNFPSAARTRHPLRFLLPTYRFTPVAIPTFTLRATQRSTSIGSAR